MRGVRGGLRGAITIEGTLATSFNETPEEKARGGKLRTSWKFNGYDRDVGKARPKVRSVTVT